MIIISVRCFIVSLFCHALISLALYKPAQKTFPDRAIGMPFVFLPLDENFARESRETHLCHFRLKGNSLCPPSHLDCNSDGTDAINLFHSLTIVMLVGHLSFIRFCCLFFS